MKWEVVFFFSFLEKVAVLSNTDLLFFVLIILHWVCRKEGWKEGRRQGKKEGCEEGWRKEGRNKKGWRLKEGTIRKDRGKEGKNKEGWRMKEGWR